MALSDYTYIVARFSEEVGAAVFAKFVASEGISCHIADLREPAHYERYGVRVQHGRIAELRRILQLRPVASGMTPFAAQMMAGRLAREGIPCCVADEHSHLFGEAASAVGARREFGHKVAVPEYFLEEAVSFLNVAASSGAEATESAPRTLPDPERPF